MADSAGPKYRAPALEKGLAVLELLAGARRPMSLNVISRHLKRSVSELFRMIQVLEFRGYLEISSSGEGYVLSNKLFALGMTRAPTRDLHDAALPVMHKLTERIGQSCHLGVASADQMVIVARVEAPGDLGFSVRIGYRRSLIDSTSGLVLYAFQSDLVRTEWKARLSGSVSRRAWVNFERRGHAARRAGFVKSESQAVEGVIDISAPVTQSGSVAAALTIPYVKTARSLSVEDTVRPIVLAAREISSALGGDNRPIDSAHAPPEITPPS
jgi:DNA-binding IclR family transcriptional regulator